MADIIKVPKQFKWVKREIILNGQILRDVPFKRSIGQREVKISSAALEETSQHYYHFKEINFANKHVNLEDDPGPSVRHHPQQTPQLPPCKTLSKGPS